MSDSLMDVFFGNIDPLYDFHCSFLAELEDRFEQWWATFIVYQITDLEWSQVLVESILRKTWKYNLMSRIFQFIVQLSGLRAEIQRCKKSKFLDQMQQVCAMTVRADIFSQFYWFHFIEKNARLRWIFWIAGKILLMTWIVIIFTKLVI